jgi:hypothetical protein
MYLCHSDRPIRLDYISIKVSIASTSKSRCLSCCLGVQEGIYVRAESCILSEELASVVRIDPKSVGRVSDEAARGINRLK